MKKLFISTVLISATYYGLQAQTLEYKLAAPNAAHHEAEITLTATKLPAGPAVFLMSRSSPGRYASHEFGKNVYNLKATNEKGKSLNINRTGADVYEVSGHNGIVNLQYTLYANHADGTYAGIDPTGYHLNMPATFMWVKGMEQAPISLSFEKLPVGWTVATQLFADKSPHQFTAPNLQYFMDAPTKAGQLRYRQWQINGKNGKSQIIRIAFDTEAKDAQLDAMAEKVKKIVAEAEAIFGELPDYETGTYTFLASLNPYVQGDGMEHRNSTMISLPVQASMIEYALGTFSHEFFHCWNVERIRPKTIEPFNFEHSNVSDGLWLAEGFTQYYGQLIELRSGLINDAEWLFGLAGFINTKQHRPGGTLYNVIENSQHAVFADAGTAIDKNNFDNIFSSYYVTGAATALALDLELRNKFGKTLDNFMQTLWQKHGKTGKPYTMQDLQAALAITTGDEKHAAIFFNNYVFQSNLYDYAAALEPYGISPAQKEPGKAWLGPNRLDEKNGRLLVNANTRKGTPMYEAGIDIGDEIMQVEGKALKTLTELNHLLAGKKPGDKIQIVFKHRGIETTTTATLGEMPDVQLSSDANATPAQLARRAQWFSSQVK